MKLSEQLRKNASRAFEIELAEEIEKLERRAVEAEARAGELREAAGAALILVGGRAEDLLRHKRPRTAEPWLQCRHKMSEALSRPRPAILDRLERLESKEDDRCSPSRCYRCGLVACFFNRTEGSNPE